MPEIGVKVEELAQIIGVLTGLGFIAPEIGPESTIATGLCILLTCAIITRVLAAQRNRRSLPWFAAGLFTGFIGVTLLLLLDRDQA